MRFLVACVAWSFYRFAMVYEEKKGEILADIKKAALRRPYND
ncbi:hypothetical protein [Vibrio phage vB_VruC_PG21]|uniref:Uncharacterized protein n=1 Tax=Vibrio phage vB_VruC_PG21 TaxID=2928757 RepID=A0AAE9GP83_9VIRU|nr:hypothetical protein [Vibrio phage vB_VruC_PG21]